jgi:pimeloyl-ACP methyl ester carboxylesterase
VALVFFLHFATVHSANAQAPPKPTASGFVQAGNARLYYETFGTRGEPIILIHGVTLDRRMWDLQVRALVQAGFRVVRYDAQNYGKSLTTPPLPDSSQTEDLRALMDALKITKATLVGLSMGGNIASRFAIEFPDRVQRLVLVSADMNGFTGYTPELYAVFTETFKAAAVSVDSAKKVWSSGALLTLRANQKQAQPIVQQIIAEYSGDFFFPQKGLSVQPQTITSTRLAEIKAPTLIVVGAQDMKDFHLMADLYEKGIAGSRRVTLANAGHLCNMEQPTAFNAEVVKFLKSKR